MNKGLFLSLLLFVLLCGAILADALFVTRATDRMHASLADFDAAETTEAQEEALGALETEFSRSRFLFSVSLPLTVVHETEKQLTALRTAEGEHIQTEKEALSLCLTQMRRIALPDMAQIL